uniref:Uncharacterized protein n=1 Tax=Amphimedon queenslandica TaxID=400682 RepID=A0A1X7TT24_AMPQE
MSAEEIAKPLNTGNTQDTTLLTWLKKYFYSSTQSSGFSDCKMVKMNMIGLVKNPGAAALYITAEACTAPGAAGRGV